jgi:hypothetical protein
MDELLTHAVEIVMDSMTKPAVWAGVSEAFGQILGRGRKNPRNEAEILDRARQEVLSDPESRDTVAADIREKLATIVDLREGAADDVRAFVDSFKDSSAHQSGIKVEAGATEDSVANAAGRDNNIGSQSLRSGSRRWWNKIRP